MSHPELGKKILDQVAEAVSGHAKVESAPKLDGRNMIMVLAPDRKAQQVRKPQPNGAGRDQEGRQGRATATSGGRPRSGGDPVQPESAPAGDSGTPTPQPAVAAAGFGADGQGVGSSAPAGS